LLVAVPAYAGGSTLNSGYGSTPGNVAGSVATKTPKKTTPTPTKVVQSGGTLPFTGVDLGVFGAAAIVLIGTGVAFRRLGRQNG
jgi:hypothetical protein